MPYMDDIHAYTQPLAPARLPCVFKLASPVSTTRELVTNTRVKCLSLACKPRAAHVNLLPYKWSVLYLNVNTSSIKVQASQAMVWCFCFCMLCMFQSTVFLQLIIDLHNPTIMGMVPWPHHHHHSITLHHPHPHSNVWVRAVLPQKEPQLLVCSSFLSSPFPLMYVC